MIRKLISVRRGRQSLTAFRCLFCHLPIIVPPLACFAPAKQEADGRALITFKRLFCHLPLPITSALWNVSRLTCKIPSGGRKEFLERLDSCHAVHAFSGTFKEVVHVPDHVACGFHKLLEDLHIIALSYAVYAPPHKDCVFGTCAGFRADVDSEVLCKVFP